MESGDKNKVEKDLVNSSASEDSPRETSDQEKDEKRLSSEMKSLNVNEDNQKLHHGDELEGSNHKVDGTSDLDYEDPNRMSQTTEKILVAEKETCSDSENLNKMSQTTEEVLLEQEEGGLDSENPDKVNQTTEKVLVEEKETGSDSENLNKMSQTTEEVLLEQEEGGLDSENPDKVNQTTEKVLIKEKETGSDSENLNKMSQTTEEVLLEPEEGGLDSENPDKVNQTTKKVLVEEKETGSDSENLNKMSQTTEEVLLEQEEGGLDSENPDKVNQTTEKVLVEEKERGLDSENPNEVSPITDEVLAEEREADPVFDGMENPELKAMRGSSSQSLDLNPEAQASARPGRAAALKIFVKVKGAVAISTVLRRLSGGRGDDGLPDGGEKSGNSAKGINQEEDSSTETKLKEVPQKAGERSTWNPLNFIKIGRDAEVQNIPQQAEDVYVEKPVEEPVMKGRIIVYTRLGCQECKEVRSFMHQKRLRFVEINVDIFPSRKLELEKNTGSSAVPRVYFNDFLVGGLSELKAMDESGKFDDKVNDLINEEPSPAAPLPPFPGEDDVSGSGKVDELASIVRKMRESIVLRDRFYKLRKFNNCFVGSEAVNFLAQDQYLEREEAVEFGRKLVNKHFFRHVLDENIFEDGNHLYRFLEHDPTVLIQCYNMTRGLIEFKPKPIIEIASRLRFLSFAIFEAYVSEDGRHVDYKSLHGCEEFRRYLRIIEELQRVELGGLSREEKLAFFINLYNMMAIHAILTLGYPVGALDRKKFLGDFNYVVGGCTYSLSAIQNGVLRGNQRPPYNITKPFGPRDKRLKVALPYAEPLVHFTLVCGTRSGPALRCYSPGNVDKELMEAARNFLSNGGLVVDAEAKVASVSKILQWYSGDFGKNEAEVMKHAANYLEPDKLEVLLELLANNQLRVTYQPYDWGLNC